MGFFKKNNDFITYTIDKSFTKNLAISIQNGQVAVSAPWYVSKRKIEEIISDKKSWIIQKLKEYEQLNSLKELNTEKRIVKVFGEDYNLKIFYKLIKVPELYLENKTIKIELPSKYKNSNNTKIIDLIIEKFYKKVAEKEIEETMEKTRKELGIAPDDYVIKRLDKTLGMYDEQNKVIFINPEIVKFDKVVLEYVVLHEFCHLKYKTHCKSFYNLLSKHMKNYKNVEQNIKVWKF